MTFSPGQHVQMRRDVGVVSQVLARGYAYRVAFPDGQEFVCLKEVLKPAPENVTVFRRKPVNPEHVEYPG